MGGVAAADAEETAAARALEGFHCMMQSQMAHQSERIRKMREEEPSTRAQQVHTPAPPRLSPLPLCW